MQVYTQTVAPSHFPQSLHISHGGKNHYFSLLHITLDRVLEGRPWESAKEHQHPVYHVVLYSRGNNEFILDGKRHPIVPGTLALTSPGQSHSFYPLSDGKNVVYFDLMFSLSTPGGIPLQLPFNEMLSLYAGVNFPAPPPTLNLGKQQITRLEGLFNQAMNAVKIPGPLSSFAVAQTMHSILAFLVGVQNEDQAAAHAGPSPIQRVREHLDCHFAQPFAIRDLARMAGFSPGHFLRSFKRATGNSPIVYQQQLRVKAAQTLLLNSSLSCKEIAARVGYDDTCHFSKIFKKNTGTSPVACRRTKCPLPAFNRAP
ncbi:MAG: AraC family transcriptional regulator [Verrucomicrobiae bacterium]|nr:AraC family transcriptional regulator [Verrucomicrobiae bacterium]